MKTLFAAWVAAPAPAANAAPVGFHDQSHPRARMVASLVLAVALCGFGYSLGYQRGRAADEVPSSGAQAIYEQARREGERAERAERGDQAAAATAREAHAATGVLSVAHP